MPHMFAALLLSLACAAVLTACGSGERAAARPDASRMIVKGALTYRARIAPQAGAVDVGTLDMKPFTALAFASELPCGDRTVTNGSVVPFRATGNEPGWRLDIGESEMTLLADNGETRLVTPTPTPEKAQGSRKYVATSGGSDLTVTILDQLCTDSMTGMPHPNTVVVLFQGRTLNGCGGDPAALLRDGEWVVQDISGVRLANRSRITLAFGPDGRISGNASCNRYSAAYSLTGEGMLIAKVSATRMACEPPLMRQEQAFLDLLSRVNRFEIGPSGTLILHTGDRRTITARRG